MAANLHIFPQKGGFKLMENSMEKGGKIVSDRLAWLPFFHQSAVPGGASQKFWREQGHWRNNIGSNKFGEKQEEKSGSQEMTVQL